MACSKMSVEQQTLMDNRDFIINYLDADNIIDQLIKANLISQNAAGSLMGPGKSKRQKSNCLRTTE